MKTTQATEATQAMKSTRVAASRPRKKKTPGALPTHVTLVLMCAAWLVPALGLVVTSFRTTQDMSESGWWTFFTRPALTLDNYTEAFQSVDMGTSMLTSAMIAVPTTLMVVLLSAVAGYVFARMRFRGRNVLFLLVVSLLVVPPQVTLAPMLRLLTSLGLSGTLPAVWIYQVGLSIPFGVMVLRNAFAALPQELFEAARIDGASETRTFFRIALPLSTPSLAAVATLQFLWAWNDLLSPLIFLGGNSELKPVTTEIAGLVQATGSGENLLVASAVLAVVVPVLVFVFFQRFFVRGVLGGSVKG
ncbi:carbohydrate ABC transporter permease [Streptomyces sp. NPDC059455]|uniref:carbohydrate ABC transporter permease n=1 Tax=Streptomyces sp. NPDC059455 TaxID=3346837 RepID=UPI00368A3D64